MFYYTLVFLEFIVGVTGNQYNSSDDVTVTKVYFYQDYRY